MRIFRSNSIFGGLWLCLGAAFLLAGCSGSGATATPDSEDGGSVGYGGADAVEASSVSSDDIRSRPGRSIEEILRGRVSGVRVTEAPGGLRITIRGATSIHGGTDPLYIIDGMPITPGPNGLVDVNAFDIERITVLKNAADTAIYGARGANGVIVIETKRAGD